MDAPGVVRNKAPFRARIITAALLLVASCSRTGLLIDEAGSTSGEDRDGSALTLASDARAMVEDASHSDAPRASPPPKKCAKPEICNGEDDDCNGEIDDNIAPIPCPGGGSRYCVVGQLSECPTRCNGCLPGGERVCFVSYCTFWGVQKCAADGRTFSGCQERVAPPECEHLARPRRRKELEQCCIDNGYCCVDEFDLDNDGSKSDMVGDCEEALCP